MACAFMLPTIILSCLFLVPLTEQKKSTDTQLLLQLRKQLEYPIHLGAWNNTNDLCYAPTSPSQSITCDGSSVTELKIVGDKLAKPGRYVGYSVAGKTLSPGFSVDSFVTTLTRLTSLKVVILVSLGIWGPLPDKIHRLYSLEVLDLSSNFFYGSIPPKISAMKKLHTFSLDGNYFNDTVPDWFASLDNLMILSLRRNGLKGLLPGSISRVSTLTELALSGNSISGQIPNLSSLNSLETLDLGDNRNCHRAIAEKQQLPKSVPSTTGFSSELLSNARYISQAMKLGTPVLPTYRTFSLEELKEATNNFEGSAFIGEGSTGKLYKGRLDNGTFIAIRCLSLFKRYSIRNLKFRLDLLSKLRHPHLVCLLGHCIDTAQDDSSINRVFLIYEYVANGNLQSYLSERSMERALKWPDRLVVLIGIAKAVHFLHSGIIPGLYNNQLKTKNILLDEHFIAKVSDYGLSIIMEEIYKHEARAEGQKPIQSKSPELEAVNLEDDVYSLGYILLEALMGPSVSEQGSEYCLKELAMLVTRQTEQTRVLDPVVLASASQDSLSIVISITSKCLYEESSRPSVEDVLWNLQYAAQVQATADGDRKSDIVSQA
ncbi:STYKc [Musa troglodytarum]|uniref:STYKc n=1 Tax=Musa troglodytarum TaxID=320322 RepID=A0A9E7HVP9_9LILI|nr:STYKc [Musa troglodytarum]